MAKSDLNNFECFPIWRIDPGKMMKKYELFLDKGKILHMATCTVSLSVCLQVSSSLD